MDMPLLDGVQGGLARLDQELQCGGIHFLILDVCLWHRILVPTPAQLAHIQAVVPAAVPHGTLVLTVHLE